jgi:hypothetical protein
MQRGAADAKLPGGVRHVAVSLDQRPADEFVGQFL